MNCVSSCVNMNTTGIEKNWFGLFVRKWHHNKWRCLYFPTTLSSQVLEVEMSKTIATIFTIFYFSIPWILWTYAKYLLEQNKLDLDFLCGNGTITSGRGYIFHKNQFVTPCFTKEWDNSYLFNVEMALWQVFD
jgi:hypothetical protein